MTDKPTPGGKRDGAGRPAIRGVRKVTTSMRLTPDVLAYLAQHDETAGELIESAIRRTADFRRWSAANERS